MRDLADESGEGQFAEEEVGAFLVFADFPEGEGPGAVFAATGDREGVAGCVWGEGLARSGRQRGEGGRTRYSAAAAAARGGFAASGFAASAFPTGSGADDCFSAGLCTGHCGMTG